MRVELPDTPVGATIRDVDLSRALEPATAEAIARVLDERGVIAIADQHIDDAAQIRFSRHWGAELDIHPFRRFAKPANPEVFVLSNMVDAAGEPVGAKDAAQYWHTDLSYSEFPSSVSILYGVTIPRDDAGRPLGETEFASTMLAYDALDEATKARLAGLRAVHDAMKPKPGSSGFMKPLDAGTKAALKEVTHPVVRVHPRSGRRCLYVNPGFTTRIVGLAPDESDALLETLFAHILDPRFRYVHRWSTNDVVVWDNCATIHQGVGNYRPPQWRLMYRTIVKGPATG